MTKWLVLGIRGHKHEQRTQTEALKSNWLTLEDHGVKKGGRGLL